MDYSEAGDRVGIDHASIGTTLDSVKFNGSLATYHASVLGGYISVYPPGLCGVFGGFLEDHEACACVCGLETIALYVFIWVCV